MKAQKITLVVGPEVVAMLPACPRCGVGAGEPCVHARYGHGLCPIVVHPHAERTRGLRDRVEVLLGVVALAEKGDRSLLNQVPEAATAENGWRLLRRQLREARR
jgi:hypothetical protein